MTSPVKINTYVSDSTFYESCIDFFRDNKKRINEIPDLDWKSLTDLIYGEKEIIDVSLILQSVPEKKRNYRRCNILGRKTLFFISKYRRNDSFI